MFALPLLALIACGNATADATDEDGQASAIVGGGATTDLPPSATSPCA